MTLVVLIVAVALLLLSVCVGLIYVLQIVLDREAESSTAAVPGTIVPSADVPAVPGTIVPSADVPAAVVVPSADVPVAVVVPSADVPDKKKIIMKVNNPAIGEILLYYLIQGIKIEVYKGKVNSTIEISIPQDADKIELHVVKDKIDITDVLLDGQSIIHTIIES